MMSLNDLQKHLNEVVIGQEESVKIVSTTVYKYLMKLYARDFGVWFDNATTLLLIGNTGVGKTYLAKKLSELLNLYFIEINGKSIAQENWSGKSFVQLIEDQLHPGAEGAIIFVDEFDKMLTKNTCSGGDDVSYHLQTSILKYIEGFKISNPRFRFDTKKCLFIFAGAFVGLQVQPEKHIGFNDSDDVAPELHDALIKFGMIPELAGRMQNITMLKDLTEKEYYSILDSEQFIYNKYKLVLEKFNICETVCKKELIDKVMEKKLGVRGLIQEVERYITNVLLENEKLVDIEKLEGVYKDSRFN